MPNSLSYSERTRKMLKVTLLGGISNVLLVLLELVIGILGHSSALIAEAINSISDFVTDLITLAFRHVEPEECPSHQSS